MYTLVICVKLCCLIPNVSMVDRLLKGALITPLHVQLDALKVFYEC